LVFRVAKRQKKWNQEKRCWDTVRSPDLEDIKFYRTRDLHKWPRLRLWVTPINEEFKSELKQLIEMRKFQSEHEG